MSFFFDKSEAMYSEKDSILPTAEAVQAATPQGTATSEACGRIHRFVNLNTDMYSCFPAAAAFAYIHIFCSHLTSKILSLNMLRLSKFT